MTEPKMPRPKPAEVDIALKYAPEPEDAIDRDMVHKSCAILAFEVIALRAIVERAEAVLAEWNESDKMPNGYTRATDDCASELHRALRGKP